MIIRSFLWRLGQILVCCAVLLKQFRPWADEGSIPLTSATARANALALSERYEKTVRFEKANSELVLELKI